MKRFSENALVERSGSRGVIAIARTMSFVRDDVRRGGYVAKHPTETQVRLAGTLGGDVVAI